MAVRHWIGFAILAFLAAVVVQNLVCFGYFEHVYDHLPGKCIQFEMNGAEDMALLPNDQVLISSGLYLWRLEGKVPKPDPGIFMLNLNEPAQGPKKLSFDRNFQEKIQDFVPHGVGHWVTEDGLIILYVINHRKGKDFVESFLYNPDHLSLKHRKSFSHPLLRGINDLVLIALDEFYITNDHYFDMALLTTVELILKLPLTTVTYYNGITEEAKIVAGGLKYANGIAMSNNGRFVYVSNLLQGEVNAYTRNQDNSLKLLQTLPLQVAIDNLFVSPTNGHLWVAILPQVLQLDAYILNNSTPIAGRIIHVVIDERSELPFDGYQVEEVFATTGHNIGATTIGIYHKKKLLVGSITSDMMYCEVPLLMYE